MAIVSSRGMLIRPILVEIERIDPAATKLAAAYDPVFKEPIPVRGDAGKTGEKRFDGMKRRPPIKLKAQMERGPWTTLNMQPSGNVAKGNLRCVLLRSELERKKLILPTGEPDFHVGDRLIATYTLMGALIRRTPDPPGLYLTSPYQPAGEGLGGNENLVILTFDDREQGSQSG